MGELSVGVLRQPQEASSKDMGKQVRNPETCLLSLPEKSCEGQLEPTC